MLGFVKIWTETLAIVLLGTVQWHRWAFLVRRGRVVSSEAIPVAY